MGAGDIGSWRAGELAGGEGEEGRRTGWRWAAGLVGGGVGETPREGAAPRRGGEPGKGQAAGVGRQGEARD